MIYDIKVLRLSLAWDLTQFMFSPPAATPWQRENIEKIKSGFIHFLTSPDPKTNLLNVTYFRIFVITQKLIDCICQFSSPLI